MDLKTAEEELKHISRYGRDLKPAVKMGTHSTGLILTPILKQLGIKPHEKIDVKFFCNHTRAIIEIEKVFFMGISTTEQLVLDLIFNYNEKYNAPMPAREIVRYYMLKRGMTNEGKGAREVKEVIESLELKNEVKKTEDGYVLI